jgi:uncharacterized membrane protein YeaQ/YmgE (transglycosylase-associated protein family)
MSIFAWFILGAVVGLIVARMYRHTTNALALYAVLGAVGAIGGGLAFSSFGSGHITAFSIYSWLGAAVGAFAILFGYRAIFRQA